MGNSANWNPTINLSRIAVSVLWCCYTQFFVQAVSLMAININVFRISISKALWIFLVFFDNFFWSSLLYVTSATSVNTCVSTDNLLPLRLFQAGHVSLPHLRGRRDRLVLASQGYRRDHVDLAYRSEHWDQHYLVHPLPLQHPFVRSVLFAQPDALHRHHWCLGTLTDRRDLKEGQHYNGSTQPLSNFERILIYVWRISATDRKMMRSSENDNLNKLHLRTDNLVPQGIRKGVHHLKRKDTMKSRKTLYAG